MRQFALCLSILLFATATPTVAQVADGPEVLEFDTNKNGRIDAEEATPEFLSYINKVFMPALAPDGPDATLQTASPDTETSDEAVIETTIDVAAGEAVANIDITETAAKPKGKITSKLLLRRKVEDVSLSNEAKALDAADGAVISYTNDFKQGTEEWQVQGALLYPIRYETGREVVRGTRVLSAYTFVPSASFDRKFHSTDTATEIDTLAFRLGSEWEVAGGVVFPRQYLRFSPVYATDFDFTSSVVAGELQYEALRESWGLGTPRSCAWGHFKCQWRAIMHLEGGKTLDAGDKTNLVEDEEFLRAGPKLNAAVQPTYELFNRLELKLSWFYLEELLSDEGASDLFEGAVSWRLDDNGHIRLRAQYRHGDLPLTRDKVSIVTTGLEVKF